MPLNTNNLWTPPNDMERKLRSANEAILGIMKLNNNVIQKHREELIDICLWKVTESECINVKERDNPHTKYNIRYWSVGAIDFFKDKYDKGLRHEHVITKKEMRELIFKLKKNELTLENIEGITLMARSCTVTKEEHDKLSKYDKSHQGWERYKEAEIQVFDRMKAEFVEFDDLIKHR